MNVCECIGEGSIGGAEQSNGLMKELSIGECIGCTRNQ